MLESLRNLALATSAPDQPLALRDTETLTRAALYERRQFWCKQISAIPVHAVAMHQHCGFEQLALLLAIWQSGKVAVLPAGTHHSHLRSVLSQAQIDALGDTTDFVLGVELEPPHTDTALVIYTSGSSGDAKPVAKTFQQLDAELQLLEACWGNEVADTVFISTVSRQHMYGLPFALLWPLARGSLFLTRTLAYLESLESAGSRAFTLVTSPVQLANLPPNLDWRRISSQSAQVFCAGAPLTETAAHHARQCFAKAVTEIYGSTETGVIAHRQQHRDAHWQSLPGVRIRLNDEQHLQVNSAPAGTGADEWLSLSDIAECKDDSHFVLAGRSDQIVKVGGKRLSLEQINRQLAEHPWIDEACCLVVTERRSRIGAVASLSASGRRHLIDRGRLSVNRELARFLVDRLDPLARPRLWRYVKALPKNSQGKVVRSVMRAFFLPDQQPRLPEVLRVQRGEDDTSAEWELFVPHQLFYFDGHFPGNAVLPGVVQISWALHFAKVLIGNQACFQRLEAIKFQQIVQAGDTLCLSLMWKPDTGKLQFAFQGAQVHTMTQGERKAYSSGRIGFHNDR